MKWELQKIILIHIFQILSKFLSMQWPVIYISLWLYDTLSICIFWRKSLFFLEVSYWDLRVTHTTQSKSKAITPATNNNNPNNDNNEKQKLFNGITSIVIIKRKNEDYDFLLDDNEVCNNNDSHKRIIIHYWCLQSTRSSTIHFCSNYIMKIGKTKYIVLD